MKFNKTNAAQIEVPSGKYEVIVFDDDIPGFGLRARAGGSRNWVSNLAKAASSAESRSAQPRQSAHSKLASEPFNCMPRSNSGMIQPDRK